MLGWIVNLEDPSLPADSPWRTRQEVRHQPPVFELPDGSPVYEVWFHRLGRWWCMSRALDRRLAESGVVYFFGVEQLKAWLAYLGAQPRA